MNERLILYENQKRCKQLVALSLVLLDYGLRTYRKDDGAKTLSTYQQRLVEVYIAPEFINVGADTGSYMEPTLAGDVFRYRTKACQTGGTSGPTSPVSF